MNKYEKLTNALDDTLNFSMELGAECKCTDQYICKLCRYRTLVRESKESNSVEGVRPRRKVYCITTDKEFDNLKLAGEHYGIQPATISKCCKGELRRAGMWAGVPLEWRYVK